MDPEAFDVVTELGVQALVIIGILGGAVAAGFGVWALGLGIDVGIKKFQKLVKRA